MDITCDMTEQEQEEAQEYNDEFVTMDIVLLEADLNAGEGQVLFSEEFLVQGRLMQADLLKDWIHVLTSEYDTLLEGGLMDTPPTLQ